MIREFCAAAGLSLAVSVAATGARANLVTNGSFGTTTNGAGQLGYNTEAFGWQSYGYNFVFAPGTADSSGSNGEFGNIQLWGPNNGSPNGLPAASPDGGNFAAADGDYDVAPIQQVIGGLTPGVQYAVSFYWAGGQQFGYTGATTEQFQVSLGDETQLTPLYHDPSHGFSGWMQQSFTFAAIGSSEILSFLAVGTPDGLPPFALLDGVSMHAIGEPMSLALMGGGLLGIGVMRRRKTRRVSARD